MCNWTTDGGSLRHHRLVIGNGLGLYVSIMNEQDPVMMDITNNMPEYDLNPTLSDGTIWSSEAAESFRLRECWQALLTRWRDSEVVAPSVDVVQNLLAFFCYLVSHLRQTKIKELYPVIPTANPMCSYVGGPLLGYS